MEAVHFPEPALAQFLWSDTRLGAVWLLLRLYLGYEWISAGWEKIQSPAWVGSGAGMALNGFLQGALHKATGPHPDVSGWYATFINNLVLPHVAMFSTLVAYGEVFAGVALILGLFTGIAGFAGAFMNMNYLFAGTVSLNPLMFLGELVIVLAWRTAGWFGLDRWVLPLVGTPWQKGKLFKRPD